MGKKITIFIMHSVFFRKGNFSITNNKENAWNHSACFNFSSLSPQVCESGSLYPFTYPFCLRFGDNLTVYPNQSEMAVFSSTYVCFNLPVKEPFHIQRIQRTTHRVIDAERITRGIPTFRPSFLMLTLSVNAAWIQQVNVPNPKVKEVPTLWISSSFVS